MSIFEEYGTFKSSVAQLAAHPTGDQEVAGSIPAGSATFFRGDLIKNIIYHNVLT